MAHSACVRCATCDGFPCLVHAKSDAEVLAVRPALEHPNVTLLRNARAVALHTNPSGTRRDRGRGRPRRRARDLQRGHRGGLLRGGQLGASCCSPRPPSRHPNGLSNRSDQLGRNYTFHNSQAVLALSKEANPTVFQKTLGLNDFYFGSDDFEFPLGQHPDGRQVVRPTCTAARSRSRPSWRPRARSRDMARHAVDFWLSTEDLPRPENRVTLDRDGRDPAQLQADQPRVREAPLPQAQEAAGAHRDAHGPPRSRATPTSRPTSRSRAWPTRPAPAASAPTPRRPCSNTDCRAHELDNLYVVDTSFFPSIGAVNPALTAMANALRVGDHLLERLGAERTAKEPSVPPDATDGGRPPGRDRRRRLRRAGRGTQAAPRRRRRDARRPQQPPPVPAAPLPGRGGRAVPERLRVADPALAQAQRQHHGADGRGHRGRPRAPAGGPRPRRPPRLRQPDRRVRRARPPTSATTSGRRSRAG